jgi:dihydroorotase (multifunctional complex type)
VCGFEVGHSSKGKQKIKWRRDIMETLVIKNGLVVTPQGVIRGGLAIRNDKIVQVGADDSLPKANLEVDAKGVYVLPGLIDPHVHIGAANENGAILEFRTESISGAISGVTTMMGFVRFGNMLEHRLPIYRRCKEIGKQNSFIDFKLHAYLVVEPHLEEIPGLIEGGITSAKLMLGSREEEAKRAGMRAVDLGFTYKAMKILARYGPPVLIQTHCEQPDIISVITQRLMAQGRTDFLAWAESRPAICEAIHAFSVGLISLETGCPVYIVHVSAKETVDVIRYLRGMGAKVYAETCPHYLTLTKNTSMGVLAKMAPPLRDEMDIECLWQALSDGTFDTVGSDHVVRQRREREEAGTWQGVPGVGGIGAILPLMMTEVHRGRITIEQLVKVTSENAARIWGLYPKKGVLSPGADADIVIVDPRKEWVLSADHLKSSSDYSIYEGRVVRGKAVKTFVRGKLVAEDGEVVAKEPLGEYAYSLWH